MIPLLLVSVFTDVGEGIAEVRLQLKPAAMLTAPGARLSSVAYSDVWDEIYAVDMLTGDILVSKMKSLRFDKLEVRGELKAYALTVGDEDFLFVTDLRGSGVTKITPAGDIVTRIDVGTEEAPGTCLGRIRTGPEGRIYAVERSGDRIFIFDNKLESMEIVHLGSPSDTLTVVDLTFGEGGTILALSSKGQVLRKFDGSGTYLGGFGIHSTDKSAFSLPSAITRGPDGNLWIVDSFQHTVKLYSQTGDFLYALLDMAASGKGLYFPVDIVFISRDRVALLDKGSSSIKFFEVESS